MRVLSAHGKDAALWQSYVDRLALRDVMLTPAYARVQEKQGRGDAVCYAQDLGADFAIKPGLLRPVGSKFDFASFYGGGGPFGTFSAKWCHTGLVSEYAQLLMGHMLLETHKVRDAVVVDIARTDDNLFDSFSRNRQRGIKETKRDVRIESSAVLFAHTYAESMSEKGRHAARWMFPREYWEAYINEMADDRCVILNAGNSMLLMVYGYGKAYPLFITGSDHDALYFEAMKHARDVGCTRFYLGGGTTSADDDPLLQYKLSFSKQRVGVYAYRRVYDDAAYADACRAVGVEASQEGSFPAYRSKEM